MSSASQPGEPLVLRLSFAFSDLEEISPKIVEKHAATLRELDLTSNKFYDLISLREFSRLDTLILDGNLITSQTKIPKLPNLSTLWVNKNKIANLATFTHKIAENLPNLKYLSMFGNEACPNFLNGGSPKQYQDYRHFVISRLPQLIHLDSTPIIEEERENAKKKYAKIDKAEKSEKTEDKTKTEEVQPTKAKTKKKKKGTKKKSKKAENAPAEESTKEPVAETETIEKGVDNISLKEDQMKAKSTEQLPNLPELYQLENVTKHARRMAKQNKKGGDDDDDDDWSSDDDFSENEFNDDDWDE